MQNYSNILYPTTHFAIGCRIHVGGKEAFYRNQIVLIQIFLNQILSICEDRLSLAFFMIREIKLAV